MIYIQTGLKTSKLKEIKINVSAFEWLEQYQPKNVTGDIKQFKQARADYFISGYIELDESGKLVRNNDNLIRRDLIIMDYDDLTSADEFKQAVHQSLKDYQYMLYTTISYTNEKPRYRLIIEPSRPILQHEYKTIQKEISSKIGLITDVSASTWSQLQGLPVSAVEIVNKGEKYPIADNVQIDEPKTPTQTNVIPSSISHEKAIEIFGKYLKNEHEKLQERNDYYLSIIMVLGKAVVTGEIEEATAFQCVTLLALGNAEWEVSNVEHLANELKLAGNNANYFKVNYSFLDKFQKTQKTQKRQKLITVLGNGQKIEVATDENGKAYKTLHNIENMIRSLFAIGYNDFTKEIEIIVDDKLKVLDDADKEMIRMEISKGYHVKVSHADLKTALVSASFFNTYHPIKNKINPIQWDGIQRAEKLFIDCLGVEDTYYNREITRKWLLGAVSRVYNPGCKFDMCPVLQGAQGIGKSTILEKIALGFHTAIDDEIEKDERMQISKNWIIELEEMQLIRHTDSKQVKRLITALYDEFRAPYASTIQKTERHSVFIGTTNEASYLKDKTGNRRFYPLICGKTTATRKPFTLPTGYLLQVWAEVFTWYLNGESLLCSKETERKMEELRGNAMEVDIVEDLVKQYLEIKIPKSFKHAEDWKKRSYIRDMINKGYSSYFSGELTYERQRVSTVEIMQELFDNDISGDLKGNAKARHIARVMDSIGGWEKKQLRIGERNIRGYARKK